MASDDSGWVRAKPIKTRGFSLPTTVYENYPDPFLFLSECLNPRDLR
jgi:hypothetical protein